MSIIEILWIVVKYGFIVSAISVAVAILLLLFHPLKLKLKLRSTIKGQRAELWFVYLFRLFKIGIIATPHTQDVVVKIAFWKKRLDRQQRVKPEKPDSTSSDNFPSPPPETFDSAQTNTNEDIPAKDTSATPHEQAEPSVVEPTPQADSEAGQKAEQQPPEFPEKFEPRQKDEAEATLENDKSHSDDLAEDEQTAKKTSETKSATPPQDEEIIEPEPETVKPVVSDSQQSSSPDNDESATTSSQPESFRTRLRKIKRNLAKKYRQGKHYLRIFMIKWRKLAPVAKKFYSRSKKAFKIDDPNLVIYYALHEPYITGMFQGTLAVISGTAQRIGFRFVPVPMFGQPTIYARSAATAVVMPWRLVLALFGLIFEKELWAELWQLVKLLWAKWRNK